MNFKNNLKFGPEGGVTQFATQFISVSRQYRAYNRKQNYSLGKNVWTMGGKWLNMSIILVLFSLRNIFSAF